MNTASSCEIFTFIESYTLGNSVQGIWSFVRRVLSMKTSTLRTSLNIITMIGYLSNDELTVPLFSIWGLNRTTNHVLKIEWEFQSQ